MDRSVLSLMFKNFSREEAGKCAEKMLSDFQRVYFEKYYANPFPLCRSAVMILLFVRNARLKTIMIERTDIGKHAGQISFPGGKWEPSDVDNIATAIRETKEEIGINVLRDDVVGELLPVKVPVSSFEIFPVVAFVDGIGNFSKSENEVRRILDVDIEDLHDSLDTRSVIVSGKQYDVPSFICGESVVWGATAMIMAELFSVIR